MILERNTKYVIAKTSSFKIKPILNLGTLMAFQVVSLIFITHSSNQKYTHKSAFTNLLSKLRLVFHTWSHSTVGFDIRGSDILGRINTLPNFLECIREKQIVGPVDNIEQQEDYREEPSCYPVNLFIFGGQPQVVICMRARTQRLCR